jgi:hypothetical protein
MKKSPTDNMSPAHFALPVIRDISFDNRGKRQKNSGGKQRHT